MKPIGEDKLDLLDFLVIYLLGRKGEDHKEWCHVVRCRSGDALASIVISMVPKPRRNQLLRTITRMVIHFSGLSLSTLGYSKHRPRGSPYLRVASGLETLTGSTNYILVENDCSRGIRQMYFEETPVEVHDF
jgi:hypothetical protein